MRLDTLSGALALLAAGWFGVCAVLWGVANTLDALSLVLHRFAGSWRALHEAKARSLTGEWVRTLERDGEASLAPPGAPDAQDGVFLQRSGIAPDGYTGD